MLRDDDRIERARRAFSAADYVTAASLYRELLRERPGSVEILTHLGVAECHTGRIASGRRRLRKAMKIAPAQPEIHRRLAASYRMEGRLDEAHAGLDRALRLRPGDPSFLATKADLLFLQGRHDEALALIEPILDRADVAGLGVYARLSRRLGREEDAVRRIRAHLPRVRNTADRASLLFALGATLDSMGRYDEAWEAFSEANGLREWAFPPAAYRGGIDGLIREWSAERIARLPRARTRSDLPVLVVGMYRSGTSLVERILDSHPEVSAAGELADLAEASRLLAGADSPPSPFGPDPTTLHAGAIDRAARAYLGAVRRVGGGARRVTDKHPFNFFLLGVASLLVPGARVVHCLRDPLDTCLSCYFNDFAGGSPYFTDLANIGHFYLGYRRLMDHWREVLELPMLEFRYEELVSAQEPRSRALVEFLGLGWDDACLRFHESGRVTLTASNDQVRRPIFSTSIGRWRNYERHLGPLFDALGPLADERSREASA